MFLPLVTQRRLSTTFAPVVRPMSCLIDPRYSTLSDATQSGPVWLAAAREALDRDTRAATPAARARMATQRDAPACACGASRDPGASEGDDVRPDVDGRRRGA